MKKNNPLDAAFLIIILVLLAFGLVMLFSASYAYALYYEGNSFTFILKQGVFAILGLAVMFVTSRVDYHIYRRLAFWIFGASTLLLILVLVLNYNSQIRRWITIGSFQFQPSEIAKFAVIILFAYLIDKHYRKMGTFSYGVAPFGFILAIVGILMILEPHLSGLVLILSIGLLMMFVGGTKPRWFGILVLIAAVGIVVILIFGREYMMSRIEGWLDPFSDPSDSTYQTRQSLLTIGSGGLLGLGLGNSRQKYLFLPEPQNDFIFAVICEELGFIGAAVVILLFVLFVYRGFTVAVKAPDKFGMMLVVGITAQIGLQAMLNIAVVSNTIPNTGISLPFFSAGGTALLMQLAEVGIILNVSRKSSITKE